MDDLSQYSTFSDMSLEFQDSVMIRFYRAMILVYFFSEVKVRQYAEKIEERLEKYDG